MKVLKPKLGPHAKMSKNQLTFDEAYAQALAEPDREYYTTGNQTPFRIEATRSKKGRHVNQRVLRFITNGRVWARSYECSFCTNCSFTHIDLYTEAIHR